MNNGRNVRQIMASHGISAVKYSFKTSFSSIQTGIRFNGKKQNTFTENNPQSPTIVIQKKPATFHNTPNMPSV